MLYYIADSKRKIAHTPTCFHIRHADIERIGSFETPVQARRRGYRLCKHCNLTARQYQKEETAILDASLRLGLSVQLYAYGVEIVTPHSRWRLMLDEMGRGMDLYHQNTIVIEGQQSMLPGYHLQGDVKKQTIGDYLSYIAAHDSFRAHNPVCKRPTPKKEKTPPRKGTRRYKSAQRRAEKEERKRAIGNVMSLFAQLHSTCPTA